jgi:hypothetical protein
MDNDRFWFVVLVGGCRLYAAVACSFVPKSHFESTSCFSTYLFIHQIFSKYTLSDPVRC